MKIYTIFSLLCFLFWGISDLFYKKANNDSDKYSDLKTAIVVGIVMGAYATCFMIYKEINIFKYLIDVLKYLPVSFCYILSMYMGYKGLKYIGENSKLDHLYPSRTQKLSSLTPTIAEMQR